MAEFAPHPAVASAGLPRSERLWCLGLALAGLALTIALRLHAWHEPLEADEAVYLLIADGWRQGLRPYVDLWDNKPLLTFALYRLGIALLGPVEAAPKLLSLLAVLGGGVMLAASLWRHGPWAMAGGLLVLWPTLWVHPTSFANGANVEVFLAQLALAAWLLLDWRDGVSEHARVTRLLLAWAVLLLGCLLKLVMLPYLAVPVLWAAWQWRGQWPRLAQLAGAMAALTLLLPALVYLALGHSPALLVEQLFYSTRHVSLHQENPVWRLARQAVTFPWAAPIADRWVLSLAALGGLAAWLARDRRSGGLAVGVVGATLLAILLPSSQNPHYYILWLAPVALLIARGLSWLPGRPRHLPVVLLVLLALSQGWYTWRHYLRHDPVALSYAKYGSFWFPHDRLVGQELRARGLGGGRLYADGSHPGAIFYAGALPATRHFVAWNIGLGAVSAADLAAQVMAARPPLCLQFNPAPLTPELGAWLLAYYEELEPVAGVRVWRRRAGDPPAAAPAAPATP